MAGLGKDQYPLMWMNGESDRVALYALRDITTGDTIDVEEQFRIVKRGVILGTTVAGQTTASVNGTFITMPAAVNRDAAYLLIYGVAR